MKYAILIIAIFIVSLVIWQVALPALKRKKLAEAWAEIFEETGVNITEKQILEEFKKLSNEEIDKLIVFSKDLRDKKYAAAFKQIKEVDPILAKTKIKFTVLLGVIEKLLLKK